MPYVSRDARRRLQKVAKALRKAGYLTPGEAAYITWMVILRTFPTGGAGFETHALRRGVLADVSDEYRERFAKPYEIEKRRQNGDVTEP